MQINLHLTMIKIKRYGVLWSVPKWQLYKLGRNKKINKIGNKCKLTINKLGQIMICYYN